MERHLPLPPWSLRQKIALTCRILAAEGVYEDMPFIGTPQARAAF